MNKLVGVVMVGGSLLAGCMFDSAARESEARDEVTSAPQRYVVVFRAATLPSDAASRIQRAGGTVSSLLPQVGVAGAVGNSAFASKLASDPAVLAVGREHAYGAPAFQTEQTLAASGVGAPGPSGFLWPVQWDIRRVGAPAVWSRWPSGAATPRVAVLDVGVADDHPDLAGQIDASKRTSFCPYSLGPSGQAAYPIYDWVIDFDLAQPDCVPTTADWEPHGTHVAGTIAANDALGVIGVAPQAKVGAYKVFDRYRFTAPDGSVVQGVAAWDEPLFAAMIDAASSGYPVISMSLGGTLQYGGMTSHDAAASVNAWRRVANYVNQRGTLIVAAAGNSALDMNGTLFNIPSDLPTVMAVSATGTSTRFPGDGHNIVFPFTTVDAAPGSDVLAFYSNIGAQVDVSAPGGDLGPDFPYDFDYRHLIPSTFVFPNNGAFGWAWFAGTSMATPHVSAVAAEVRALHPDWSPGRVRSWLKDTAEFIGTRQEFGHGLVNADLTVR